MHQLVTLLARQDLQASFVGHAGRKQQDAAQTAAERTRLKQLLDYTRGGRRRQRAPAPAAPADREGEAPAPKRQPKAKAAARAIPVMGDPDAALLPDAAPAPKRLPRAKAKTKAAARPRDPGR